MPLENIILDFDGIFTDLQAMWPQADALIEKRFCELMHLPLDTIKELMSHALSKVSNEEGSIHLHHGKDCGLANADLFSRQIKVMQYVMQWVYENQKLRPPEYSLLHINDTSSRDTLIETLFQDFYSNIDCIPHKGITEFLTVACSRWKTAVVSSSPTHQIKKKMMQAGITPPESMLVYGDTQKHVVRPYTLDIPLVLSAKQEPRPPQLHRPHYFKVLKGLEHKGFHPKNTAIVGDNFEFDLALPDYLDYTIVLVESPWTPEHERRYLCPHPKGFFARNLQEAMVFLEKQ